MTLTKYQRGDPMEGWNDCPPIMVQKNASSTSLGSRKSSSAKPANENMIEEEIDIEDIINKFTAYPTKASERIFSQIKDKLIKSAETMTYEHKAFMAEILDQLQNGAQVPLMKAQIIDYMMIHDGITTWCSPFKKLVESIVIESQ